MVRSAHAHAVVHRLCPPFNREPGYKATLVCTHVMVFRVLLYLQVSWTESHDDAKNERRTIKFFDKEGTSAIRKVQSCAMV